MQFNLLEFLLCLIGRHVPAFVEHLHAEKRKQYTRNVLRIDARNDCNGIADVRREHCHRNQSRGSSKENRGSRMAAGKSFTIRRYVWISVARKRSKCKQRNRSLAYHRDKPHGHDGGNEEGLVAQLRHNNDREGCDEGVRKGVRLRVEQSAP